MHCQAKACMCNRKLNIEQANTEYTKQWIFGLKKIKQVKEEIKDNDIRKYFCK